MARYRSKGKHAAVRKAKPKPVAGVGVLNCGGTDSDGLSKQLARVALAAWKTSKRAERTTDPEEVLQGVRAAAERLMEAIDGAGISFLEYAGEPYDENLRVNVVEEVGEGRRKRVQECLEPGVVINGELMHMASVVVNAEEE